MYVLVLILHLANGTINTSEKTFVFTDLDVCNQVLNEVGPKLADMPEHVKVSGRCIPARLITDKRA